LTKLKTADTQYILFLRVNTQFHKNLFLWYTFTAVFLLRLLYVSFLSSSP